MRAATRSAAAFFQSVNQIGAGTLERRINSHRNTCQDRQPNREEEHGNGKLEAHIGIERQKIGSHLRNDRNQLPGQERASYTGNRANKQTFKNKKPNDARAGSANRHSQSDFATSAAEAHEQKIRNVATCDQQNERNGGKQRRKCRPQISG